ncbi:protein-disulfide reductase DsbD domain-containing protein [Paracoccus spongiarum]|uniref:Protein-disulfide reductase DsbD family protein n=1 Tax=Paracoccus spongiarum TaxID=3064387 RepID=A0ABT9JBJ0_9RHOB|nr:protein-disulfide reductase DsbD domain-containing protein [Paracoccus sp. 2205BS29-5]MDP5307085.1 protein-disulfide reductase DsbD family protein [Paracoccus sp. 2205BS29-5]
MRHAAAALLGLCLALPALSAASAETLPPGLDAARLLPGWIDAEGRRVAALELRLKPGWKTYWRSPGDSGLPPVFDWQASRNLRDVEFHWPAPEAIRSGEDTSLGYHDVLVLPFTARPRDPALPLDLAASVDFGLCERICVPGRVSLRAGPAADAPDPRIAEALARVPARVAARPACRLDEIADGMRLEMDLPAAMTGAQVVAVELPDRPEVWVSSAALRDEDGTTIASADFVPPEAKPFDLDADGLRITLVGASGAVEMRGCAPQG